MTGNNHTNGQHAHDVDSSPIRSPQNLGMPSMRQFNSSVTSTEPKSQKHSTENTARLQEAAWYQTYSTTTGLLVMMHLLFFYHWLARKSRRKLLVSYNSVIQKRHYHKALPAILSHAPSKPATSQQTNGTPVTNVQSWTIGGVPVGQYLLRARDLYRSSVFANGRHSSGLPLLFYNAHILWSCRALEVDVSRIYGYGRLLWGLGLVAFLLDLCFTFSMLNMVRDMNHATSSPFLMGASLSSRVATSPTVVIQQVEKLLTHRTMGSLTIVTSALLVVFRHTFPFVPLQILPFLEHTRFALLFVPPFTYGVCVTILLWLSHPVHPISAVVCGTLSGMLWTTNLTSFLMNPYWSNGSIAFYLILSIVSLKASGSAWIPCVDYVSWNARGEIVDPDPQHGSSVLIVESLEQPQQEQQLSVDGEDGSDTSSHSLEERRNTESTSFGSMATSTTRSDDEDENSNLRHRLPVMGDASDDEANEEDLVGRNPLLSTTPPRYTTMRSRRAPFASRV